MMRSIAGAGGLVALIAGFAIGSNAATAVRVLPPNAESVIAATGIVPVQIQTNPLGMAIGGLLSIGGLAGVGYALLSDQDEVAVPIAQPIAASPPAEVDPFAGFSPPAEPTPNPDAIASPPPASPAPVAPVAPVDGAIELDLVTEILKLSQLCHVLIAGENGTGKTTLVMQLLKSVLIKFSDSPEFDLLIIDPKLSEWGGLYKSKAIYQPAFSKCYQDLIASVDRLEAMYSRLYQRAIKRQSTGVESTVPLLALIDEVNTWLDALSQYDQMIVQANRSCKPADRQTFHNLHNRAKSAILGIGRMGRQDKVWLWMVGQNPNLSALGFDGAADRANFTVVAVGCGDNQSGLDLALSNSKMFPHGNKLRSFLELHQGKPHQIATCSRYPKTLIITPATYQEVMKSPLPEKLLRRFGVAETDAWASGNVVSIAR